MLAIRDLEVAYGEVQVVWGVSFDVTEGQIVALIGPNGAGKSTTLKAAMGLLPSKKGSVTFRGDDVLGKATHQIVEEGMVLIPETHSTFASLSILENLEVGAYNKRSRPLKDQTLAEVFEIFPILAERKNQRAGTLSGGERQMLAIGKALMAKPDLLILDEPSLGLAPIIVERMFKVVKEINRKGVSILLVEQNVQLTLETADYGYIIEMGKIVKEGPNETLLNDPSVKDAYLSL